jgi:aminoglycoside phosphotransferase (APT) family kinase protein
MFDPERTARQLEKFFRDRNGGEAVEIVDFEPLSGGYSLVTARFTARTAAGEETLVLRADPPADQALTRTDRRLEGDLLAALTSAGVVPMPAMRWADVDGSALGTPFLILDYVDGPQLLGHLVTASPERYPELALQLAEAIGTVHNVGETAVPATFDRPASWDAYIDGFIAEWRQLEARHVERQPFIRWVASWLDSHRPPAAPLTLVHGEFQTGNVMLDRAGAMQIIDWEYAHVGDPRVDLGWLQQCAAFTPPDLIGVDPVAFCDRYCKVTGLTAEVVNPLTIAYFSILSGVRALGGLLDGIAEMAHGRNHLITSAYLVSAMPFTHRMWRQATEIIEGATQGLEAQMETVQ